MSSLVKDPNKATDTYWRSLSELENTPEFQEFLNNEFGEAVRDTSNVSRRRFMQLMGASLALAGVEGCRWDRQNILPLTRNPSGSVAGKPRFFTTAMELGGVATGLVVTSNEGRPTKIDGNPKHPTSLGGSSATIQASVLELYDPDRSKSIVRRSGGQPIASDWAAFSGFAKEHFAGSRSRGGAGLRVLAEASSSPTLADLRGRLLAAFPQAKWHEYEAVSRDNARAGSIKALGAAYRAQYELAEARVLLTLDDDLLNTHPAHLKHARDWAKARRPDGKWISRMYAVESRFSATGAAADHRLPLRSEQVKPFLMALEAMVRSGGLGDGVPGSPAAVSGGFLDDAGVQAFLKALSRDLIANRGRTVVTVGDGQPAEVHALAHRLNAVLGNVGSTVFYVADADADRPSHQEAIAELAKEMSAGQVDTLVMLGGNPVYDAPADVDFAAGLAKVKESLYLGLYANETAAACTWHLPRAHYLEAWGDVRAWDGTLTVAQPLIKPLYEGKSAIEVMAILLGETIQDGLGLVRRTFENMGPAPADAPVMAAVAIPTDEITQPDTAVPGVFTALDRRWRQAMNDGVVAGSALARVTPPVQAFQVAAPAAGAMSAGMPANGALELCFYPDPRLWDGRFANNAWLQETPEFMTKLTWDNAALMSPATAEALGVENETLVQLEVGGRKLEVAAYVMPGQAPGSIAVALGYGRTHAGKVGGSKADDVDTVGFDTYALRVKSDAWFATGLSVKATGKEYRLASTQEHWAINSYALKAREERAHVLVRATDVESYKARPDFAKHMVEHPPLLSPWKEWEYTGHRWAMTIDMQGCIGCNACVVACTSENNVPVVGKEQVLKNREMHWIRIDRYFKGSPEAPVVAALPVTCQQCENAPCESVCPVGATIHSAEGLNDMVYNRCIGTRYCSNNCPYKVRRYNFFNYHEDLKDPKNEVAKMVFNPEVTVRARGVMEKCTYCVQRIQNVKIEAKNAKRPVRDGEITTACAQACPTEAIVFGDMNDKSSRVAQLKASPRSYDLLAELNIKPRTSYLARVTNPNPELKG